MHLRLDMLHSLTGSSSTQAEFKRIMKAINDDNITHQHIPDYSFELDGNLIKIRPRGDFTDKYTDAETLDTVDKVVLNSSTMEVARQFNGGWDVYFLECEWRCMLQAKKALPNNPDGSYIGYMKWYVCKHGRA